MDTFPGSLEMSGRPDEDTDPRDVAEEQQDAKLQWKAGGPKPSEASISSLELPIWNIYSRIFYSLSDHCF
jgi:hypothetical protein